jgi:hypothetical protein
MWHCVSKHFCFHAPIALTASSPHAFAVIVIPPFAIIHTISYRQKPWLLLPKSEQLRGRFGIPSFDRETRTFLVAGRMMSKLIERKAPHQRHVFCSPDLRFLVWRSPDGVKELKSIFLLHATAVEPGISVCVVRCALCARLGFLLDSDSVRVGVRVTRGVIACFKFFSHALLIPIAIVIFCSTPPPPLVVVLLVLVFTGSANAVGQRRRLELLHRFWFAAFGDARGRLDARPRPVGRRVARVRRLQCRSAASQVRKISIPLRQLHHIENDVAWVFECILFGRVSFCLYA